jgi:tetratricopeptide (TPR) repeat protein
VTLGRVAEESERWSEAQRYYARAADVLRQPTNGVSVQLGNALILLSGTYRHQGDLTTAMNVLDEAEKATPPGERAVLTNIYSERGQLSTDLHDDDAAERWLRKAYEARRELLGEHHRVTLANAGMWGVALAKLNRLDQAEAVQRKALTDMQAALGPDSPYLDNVKKGLAGTLRRQGRVEEAQALTGETAKP